MSKHDLAARPISHRLEDSIEAHLTVVFAALAVAGHLEHLTGWSLKRFITIARRYKTITTRAGHHNITPADPLADDLRDALDRLRARQPPNSAHQFDESQVRHVEAPRCAVQEPSSSGDLDPYQANDAPTPPTPPEP